MSKGSEILITGISARPDLVSYINGELVYSEQIKKYWEDVAAEVNLCKEKEHKICGAEAKKKWCDLKFRLKKKYAAMEPCDDKSFFFTSWEKRALALIGVNIPDSNLDVTYGLGTTQTVPPAKSDPLPVINCSSMELVQIKKEEESSEDALMKDCDESTSTSSSEDSRVQNQTYTLQTLSEEIWENCRSRVILPGLSKQEETELLVAALSSRPDLLDASGQRGISTSSNREAWDDLVNEINPGKFGNMKYGVLAKKKWSDLKYRVRKKYRAFLKSQNGETSNGEKVEQLTRFEKTILKMIELNHSTKSNSTLQIMSPTRNVPLLPGNTPASVFSSIEVKKEVVLPEEIPNKSIESRLPTDASNSIPMECCEAQLNANTVDVHGGTLILLQSALPQENVVNGRCDKSITSTDLNLKDTWNGLGNDTNASKSQPIELTHFNNQVMTIIGMHCPQINPTATSNNFDSEVSKPQSNVALSSENNKSLIKSEPINIETDDEHSEDMSSSEETEEILPDCWSSNEELEESPFSHAVLEEEVDLLLTALKSNPDLIHRVSLTDSSRKAWKKVTKQLNFKGSGLWKSTKAVQQKWTSLKCRVKKKYMALQESKFALQDFKANVKPLSKLDIKVLSVLGINCSNDTEIETPDPLASKPTVVDTISIINGDIPVVNNSVPSVSNITPTANGTIPTSSNIPANRSILKINNITPAINSTTSTVNVPANVAENNKTKSMKRSELFLKTRVFERKKTTARVNLHRQIKRTHQQKRDDELLSLKRESLAIKRQILEEHRKTNILLDHILQLKRQEK